MWVTWYFFSYCIGKISFTHLRHREVHLVIVPLPHVFWILFEDVRGFSSGLDMRKDVQYSVPECLLTKLFPVPWGVTTIVANTSAPRNQYPNTHYTKHFRAGQSPVFPYWSRAFTYFWNFIFTRSRHSDSLRDGRSGERIQVEGDNYSTRPDRSWGLPSLLYNGYRIFPRGKAAGAWRWSPTPSCAEVKEQVEPYLYSPSGPSWPVPGWTLLLPLPLIFNKSAVASNLPGGFET